MEKFEVRKEDPDFKKSLDDDPAAQENIFSEQPGDVPVAIPFNAPFTAKPEDIENLVIKSKPDLLDSAEENEKQVGLIRSSLGWALIIGTAAALTGTTIYLIKRKKNKEKSVPESDK